MCVPFPPHVVVAEKISGPAVTRTSSGLGNSQRRLYRKNFHVRRAGSGKLCVEGVVLNSAFPQWGRCCCTGGIVLHLVCDCIWIILWGFLSKDNNNTNYDTTCVPTGSVLQIQVHHCWSGSSVQPVGQRGGLWRFQRGRGRRGPEIFLHAAKCQGMKWLLLPLLFEERVCDTLKPNELQTKCSLFLFFFFPPAGFIWEQRLWHGLLLWWWGSPHAKEEESFSRPEVCVCVYVCVNCPISMWVVF